MIQENRSFDHYFGQMTAYRAANGIPINGSPATIEDESAGSFSNISIATGANIAAYHTGSVCTEDLTPDWTETHKNFDWKNPAGANPSSPMDGFVSLAVQISQYAATLGIHMADQDGRRVMGYFDGNDLNYYYFMASNFAMGDHFYSPIPSNTPAQRHFLFAATSQGYVHDGPARESSPPRQSGRNWMPPAFPGRSIRRRRTCSPICRILLTSTSPGCRQR